MTSLTRFALPLLASVSVLSMTAAHAEPTQELIDAAKAEGTLTTIALPHNWCGYGDVIAGFKAKYGLDVNELNPNAGSADELEAIKANMGNTGPQAPDVIDVGLSFGPAAKDQGLIQPYKVSVWDSIPDDAKDAEGYWYGDYYGVLAFGVNKDIIPDAPTSFADLMDSAYANSIAIPGDPRTGNSTMMTVYAAGVAQGAAAGGDALNAGITYFKDLKENGNYVPVNGNSQNLAQGTTPIYFDWDYNLLAMRDTLAGNPPVEVVVPSDAVVAGVYVQAISAYAPHPNAAKLWMEYIYSDEGQTLWLKGYCHPIRFNDMAARGVIPQDLMDKLPPAENYAKAVFPTLDEQAAAKSAIADNWGKEMGVN
ncbi:MAG: ABC transporter substrate-binding protein [Alphaproteobacteria bacterium]|uniref:Putative spermidine/putrescine transport system substrate-binding protein n=1 Tax=Celeribacter baekdonensis TaxID=875171 RepID=A0A1G7Q8P7_9RHOB|nr:ABC transporter substrate-binding protein [Celeribacter baekdonensis]MBU0642898.1 ABC transporter substrate-binding protein [Alphaproteobacteria bacterium]MBU1280155.1 ABC transporter substrate-binding protein [Alphaproteobacteria bacterium]MBU1575365.1 ABC transporter substrate-binding protein [Alphaproteobacteria bacterium]MBU1829594.1 ABC transporter substrate-binding protein [Alphaproteobacteria bacterium]MBU2077601.1 ABC transporter substrate-binding protein [Alphaproteobacteria bacter